MSDIYTILLLRSAGTGLLAVITFIAFLMFYFSTENGTSKLFSIVMLFISLYTTMATTTGMAIVSARILANVTLSTYSSFWLREAIAVWATNAAIIALGIYLLRKQR